jgi:multiple sugar transport system substrate-binding protein
MGDTMTFKSLVLPVVFILFLSAIAGCCPGLPEKVVPTEHPRYDVETYGMLESVDPRGQVVVFWHSFEQRREDLLLALVDEFNATNQWGITVIGEYAGSSNVLYADVLSRTESGVLPQIVIAERYQLAAYAMQDALVALDPYVESRTWGYDEETLEDFFPVALAVGQLPRQEGLYGWPLHVSAEAMYYNEDWLVELGYTEPPTSWEAFRDMACAASDPGAGTYGYEFSVNALTFADGLLGRGGQVLDEDAQSYAFSSVEGLETLTFTQDLIGGDCAVLKTERFGDRADFGDGVVLFTIGSTSELAQYREAVAEGAGFNWSITLLPTDLHTPKVLFEGPVFAVFRATPEKQLAAWLFLRWLAEPQQQARWAQAFSTFPIRVSAVDMMEDYLAENPQHEKALGLLQLKAAIEPGVIGYGECRNAVEEMLLAVARRGEPGVWLANTADACNASLEEASVLGR